MFIDITLERKVEQGKCLEKRKISEIQEYKRERYYSV